MWPGLIPELAGESGLRPDRPLPLQHQLRRLFMSGLVRGLPAAVVTVATVALGLIPPANAAPASPVIAYSANSFFPTPPPTSGGPAASTSGQGISCVDTNDPYDYPRVRGLGGNPWGIGYAEG